MLHHSVQDREQFPHACGQGHFFGFARSAQALIKPCEHRIVSDSNQRTHVQGGSDMPPTTPDRPRASPGPTVTIEGGDPYESGNALAASGAQLRQVEEQGSSTHGANARHTAEQCLALTPDGAGPQGRVEIIIEGR